MRPYWFQFEDGTEACCDGWNEEDARRIAEHLTGKKVKGTGNEMILPASPAIWQFEHPITGRTPLMCGEPRKCSKEGRCQYRYACSE